MQNIALTLITAPATEPVSLTEVKNRLRITISDEDTDLTALITEARAAAEAECQRAFVTQTWSLFLDRFPTCNGEIRVPRPPLQSVTWVKYYDTSGVQQTLSNTLYYVDSAHEPGRIVPTYSTLWPVTQYGRPGAVEVRFVAGYTVIPAEVASAIKLIMAARRDDPAGDIAIPPAARRELDRLETGEVR